MPQFAQNFPPQAQVYRASFHSVLAEEHLPAAEAALAAFSQALQQRQQQGGLLTASLFRYEQHLFFYGEGLDAPPEPEGLCPALYALLLPWPPKVEDHGVPRRWAAMQPYYYHARPGAAADWMRDRHPQRQRGRIAVLPQDKWCSYIEHHLRLVREEKIAGDRWHLICAQENLLFSYLEEPRTNVNLCGCPGARSEALDAWTACDPESHFQHFDPSQQDGTDCNFVFLPRCAGT